MSMYFYDSIISSFSLELYNKITIDYKEIFEKVSNSNYYAREEHQYFCDYDKGISLITINNGVYHSEQFVGEHKWEVIEGIDGKIIYQEDFEKISFNFIPYETWQIVTEVIDNFVHEKYTIICQENKLYIVESNNIWIIEGEFFSYWADEERQKLLDRPMKENSMLYFNKNFKWKYPVNSGRFEELIADILETDTKIDQVRLLGKTNNSDGGRDILIYKREKRNSELYVPYLIIGQCKAYKKSVNKSNVSDIRDMLDYYNAKGLFLAVTSNITVPLIDNLCKLQKKYEVDWWNEREIFMKLRQNFYLVNRYSDIIEVIE